MSGCRNDLGSILSYSVFLFAISLPYLSRCGVFRGIHVSEIHFRELSRNILKRIPCVPYRSPPAMWESLDFMWFYQSCNEMQWADMSCMPPIASSSSSSSSSFTSSSSTHLHPTIPHPQPRAPDLIDPYWSSVSTAGPQPRAPDLSGHSRHSQTSRIIQTPRAPSSARSQWVLPGLNRERRISVGIARISQTPRHCHILSHIMPLPYIPLHSPITWYHMIFHWGGPSQLFLLPPPLCFMGIPGLDPPKGRGGGGEQKCNFGPARS